MSRVHSSRIKHELLFFCLLAYLLTETAEYSHCNGEKDQFLHGYCYSYVTSSWWDANETCLKELNMTFSTLNYGNNREHIYLFNRTVFGDASLLLLAASRDDDQAEFVWSGTNNVITGLTWDMKETVGRAQCVAIDLATNKLNRVNCHFITKALCNYVDHECQNDDLNCSCPTGYYGANCDLLCNMCDGMCHRNNGSCIECLPGYADENCQGACSDTCNLSLCERYTRKCTHGCESGWTGGTCNETCFFCAGDGSCTQEDHICYSDCENRFNENTCSYMMDIQQHGNEVVYVVTLLTVVAVALTVIALLMRRKEVSASSYTRRPTLSSVSFPGTSL